jgi:hypothetical protein
MYIYRERDREREIEKERERERELVTFIKELNGNYKVIMKLKTW